MRVCVYVDGFNFYYRALKKRNPTLKWLNFVKLSELILKPTDTVQHVRYFTARVSPRGGDVDAPRRQQIYLSALQTEQRLSIHYGRFLAKTKFRPLVSDPTKFVEIHDTEEKGSDVSLASHLLNDAWQNRFDVALVFSQDSDLIEPLRMVSQELKKPVGLVWADSAQPSKTHTSAIDFVWHIRTQQLRKAQFPNPVIRANGKPVYKPASW